ncbi:TCR/Tet family MFS transporter [Altererythrobacter lutimaris]|uniref:TCR/Tet family MFS transporter n=1 Tax=Altererythrobacter lutimaris TaxID=2743979 RepID=A0A850H9T0_9SPHN|nr:TCR/Tet family MFS transporter [Altererythrobacter lutimaris]NVE93701.1 TCR/Tet family MFS transporter [Altererythrobacter lutimaris]
MNAAEGQPPEIKATLGMVAFIVFIDMVGIGLIIPVMPTLLETITGEPVDRTAGIGGLLAFAYALMQFLFAPVIGGLSDRYGRRPVLLITLLLLGIDYIIMALAPDLWWLFVGRLLSGIMGASWAAANSCVADIARREERGKYFGILGGAGASGFVIGPALGGLLGSYDERLPFIMAAIFAISGAIVGYFILRETLSVEKRRRFTMTRANPFGTIVQMGNTPVVLGFLVVIFFMQLAAQSTFTVWAYYNLLLFGWDEFQIGISVAFYGLMLAIVQGVLTGLVIARIGANATATLGFLFALPAYLLFSFAPGGWAMILGIFLGGFAGMTFPALQQLMSERIADDAQGELQGAVASMVSLTSIIGPLVMTGLFGYFADDVGLFFPGAPFLLSVMILVLALALLRMNLKRVTPL